MRQSWWKQRADLDPAQQNVILLPRDESFLLTGPPGSGKTNLLLLRAKFLSSSGLKDVLFLTVGKTLQEFIVTGVGTQGLIATNQILTVRKWIMKHLREYSPSFMKDPPSGKYDVTQSLYAAELERVNKKLPQIYNAILIDEVQDLTAQELRAIARLTKRLMVAGDARQQIYGNGEGLVAAQAMGLKPVALEYHYRIGRKICEAADSVLPPMNGEKPLTQTCNYDEKALQSTRRLVPAKSFDAQLALAIDEIRVQLKAYPGEAIGILVPNNELFPAVRAVLQASDLTTLCTYHEPNGEREFPEDKRVFVMTIHSAKGTEFRAVHIVGAENLWSPFATRKVIFTAFTRAKTSLAVYHTCQIEGFIQSAFATAATPDLNGLFS